MSQKMDPKLIASTSGGSVMPTFSDNAILIQLTQKKMSSCEIELWNNSDERWICFRFKANIPKNFLIKPSYVGILEPKGWKQLEILLLADDQSTDYIVYLETAVCLPVCKGDSLDEVQAWNEAIPSDVTRTRLPVTISALAAQHDSSSKLKITLDRRTEVSRKRLCERIKNVGEQVQRDNATAATFVFLLPFLAVGILVGCCIRARKS